VLTIVMSQLSRERVPMEVKSAGRALEAAQRLLEALGVEAVDELVPCNVVPLQRRAGDR
jgi:hypothetical protein